MEIIRNTKALQQWDKREAIDKVKAYKVLVKEYFPVEKVYLFGSYAKDSFREDSDSDVSDFLEEVSKYGKRSCELSFRTFGDIP
ncbi:hypothetical protein EZS27_009036 [termite gut metagenome]|uniref:Polymerase beta nucleotidyltransferase domain-containing protein n=1 Tax=termite gut metagenome TaxID=433724 RepID=A0A5J4SD72_9ZZZZ